jgi:hypothetical protein
MSVDNWTDDLASVVRYALATTRATVICPFHENVTMRVGEYPPAVGRLVE